MTEYHLVECDKCKCKVEMIHRCEYYAYPDDWGSDYINGNRKDFCRRCFKDYQKIKEMILNDLYTDIRGLNE